MNALQQFRARVAQRADDQRGLNQLASLRSVDQAGLVAAIRGAAERQVAEYPQYAGHFDQGWQLVRFARRVKTKAGVAFELGDVALARQRTIDLLGGKPGWFAWSIRNGVETAVPSGAIRALS